MQISDKTVRDAIRARLLAADGDARVLTRQKLALREKDWHAALRSISKDNVINGWMITRASAKATKLGDNHFEYEWTYALMHFRSVKENGANDNSELALNDFLDAAVAEFEKHPTLGFDEPFDLPDGSQLTFDNHGELQVDAVDTINNEVHFVQCRLACHLTKQG